MVCHMPLLPPKVIAPRHSSETYRPVLPRRLYRMAEPLRPHDTGAKRPPRLLRDHQAPALFVAAARGALFDGGGISAGAVHDCDEFVAVLVADLDISAAQIDQ